MNRMRTILVEDEGAALRRLEKMASRNPFIKVIASAKSGKEAVSLINKTRPDFILLDIELKDLTAFEVLDQIQNTFNGQIVFVTAFDQYAIEAFNIAATDYLLKPFDEARFSKAVERVWDKKQKTDIHQVLNVLNTTYKQSEKIEMKEGTKTYFFQPNEILWIEAKGYYSNIHKVDASNILIRITLKELEKILPDQFARVNRSSIINKHFIEKVTNNIAQQYYFLKGGVKIKKSTGYVG